MSANILTMAAPTYKPGQAKATASLKFIKLN